MKAYPINLYTILNQLSERHNQASGKVKSNIGLILNELEKLAIHSIIETLPRENEQGKTLIIHPNTVEFVNTLSLQLLLIQPNSIVNALTYHSKRFESNQINPDLDFRKLVEIYVCKALKTNATLMGIEEEVQTQLMESIFFFLDSPCGTNHSNIYFNLKDSEKKKLILGALKLNVDEESKNFLNDFLSERIPKQRIKFIVSVNKVVELFNRFRKYNIIEDEYSNRQISIWLSDRCFFLAKRRLGYQKMKHTYIQNIFKKRNCGIKLKERIVPDLR